MRKFYISDEEAIKNAVGVTVEYINSFSYGTPILKITSDDIHVLATCRSALGIRVLMATDALPDRYYEIVYEDDPQESHLYTYKKR